MTEAAIATNERFEELNQILFVYGTLKSNFTNYKSYLEDAQFLGSSVNDLRGVMFHLGHYPAVNLSEGMTPIFGEIYKVSWNMLARTDILEGHPSHYFRTQTYVPNRGRVWIYQYPREFCVGKDMFVIPDGKWKGPLTRKEAWKGWGKGFVNQLPEPPKSAVATVPFPTSIPIVTPVPVPGKPGLYNLLDQKTGELCPEGPFELKKAPVREEPTVVGKVVSAVKDAIFGDNPARNNLLPAPTPVTTPAKPRVRLKKEQKYSAIGPGVAPAKGRKAPEFQVVRPLY